MGTTTDFLMNLRRVMKLQESMLKEICGKYHLSLIEATIISFLYNNPQKDTAADIVELRMLSKGNVSQAVEGLIQKGLLRRENDPADRRKYHLSLTAGAKPITDSVEHQLSKFYEEVFEGISEQEREQYYRIQERITCNTKNAMARRGLQ